MNTTNTNRLTPSKINNQLQQILSNKLFVFSPTLSHFLQFMVEEVQAGNQKQLNEYAIGTKLLSREHGFDPQIDPIVGLQISRLRRSLNEYYLGAGSDDPIIISIPKDSYVPEFALNSNTVMDTL